MKKLTLDFIKKEFKKENYILLTEKYIDNTQKLSYICPKGHKHSIGWNSFKQGARCPYCRGTVKKTIGFIKSEFEKENYILLSTEYKNAHQKLSYVCPKGHEHKISWVGWCRPHRCPYCAGQGKPTIDFIQHAFKKDGYKLLSKIYINSKTKLKYICCAGHKHSITWSDWKSGYRCPYCNGNPIITIDYVREKFGVDGYELLATSYINNKTKLGYSCPENHIHSITWNDWIGGYRCPTCANIKMSGSGHPNWKGGISCEPYCDVWIDKDFKESIRERDNYTCQNPDCWRKDCKDGALSIHHVDYNKKSCGPKNLITVCRSCNARANKDREWHKLWYQAVLSKRYGYKYESSKIAGR